VSKKLLSRKSTERLFLDEQLFFLGEGLMRKLVISGLVILLIFAASFNFEVSIYYNSTLSRSSPTSQQISDEVDFQKSLTFDFRKYHTMNETISILQTFQSAYPTLMRAYVIGYSFEGREIWAAEITNFLTGAPLTKPAMLFVGPHHGNEIIGKEIALYYIWYLLTNYGVNEKVTRILDEKTVYVIPCVNVDGNDWTLKGQYQRYNCRPMDDDGDGLLDEDPPEDLDGDGKIMDMRFWNATKGNWDYYPEGLDKDGDGFCTDEGFAKADGIGGIDLNRNYPKGWTNYTEHGAYPFSEPETATLRDFMTSHPNIATAFDTHSGAVCLIYPWTYVGTLPPDNQLYLTLRAKYENLTGYTYHRIAAQGTSVDWVYDTQSTICFTMELFGEGFYPGGATQFEKDYPDVNVSWHNFTHPQLGNVEIGGGWIFRLYNPPEAEIEKWALKVLPMLIDLVEITPKLSIAQLNIGNGIGAGIYNVSTTVANTGFLDTATLQALQTHTNRPVNVTLSFSTNIELVNGNQTISFAVIKGGKTINAQWQIRIKQAGYTWVKISVASAKGGVDETTIRINVPERELLHVIP
jgi:hypothetical protein